MKIYEIITQEAISYSTLRDQVINTLADTITDLVNKFPERFADKHEINTLVYEFENFEKDLKMVLAHKLTMFMNSVIKKDVNTYDDDINAHGFDYKSSVKFADVAVASAGRNYILLPNKTLEAINGRLFYMLDVSTRTSYKSSYPINARDWRIKIKEKPFSNYDLFNHGLKEELDSLTSTFIHELVHIRQHSVQPADGNTEYRSYTIKNKQKFYAAINRIHNGVYTEIEALAHASSPQEIPARAHEFVVEFVNKIISSQDTNVSKMEPTKENIAKIKSYIKELDPRIIIDQTYQQFNRPGTKEYKIYKRFMKIVVQEINAYREYLMQHLERLNQELKSGVQ